MDKTILCCFEDRTLAQLTLSRLSALFEFSSVCLPDGTMVLECTPENCPLIIEKLAFMGAAWVKAV